MYESLDSFKDTVVFSKNAMGVHNLIVSIDLVSVQEMNLDWLHAASCLLVALGSRLPDMVRAKQLWVVTVRNTTFICAFS